MVNIFSGLSQNHIESFEQLIRTKNIDGQKILLTNNSLRYDNDLWDEIICSKKSFNNNSENIPGSIRGIISKIKGYKFLIKSVKKYKANTKISVYITYIEDILNNFLLLSFNPNTIGFVVEDGTLNYYSHNLKNLDSKKVFLKWFLSNLMGIRFKYYRGHSSGIEYNHVKKQYLRAPELGCFPEKSELLSFKNHLIKPSNTILIIGQEAYINKKGEDKYYLSLERLIEIIKTNHQINEIDKIYYKPHHHGKRINYKFLKNRLDKLEIIESKDSLEQVYFQKLKSEYIYGFDSSALLNIFLGLDQKIKTQIKFNVLLNYNDSLAHIFKRFNFKIYK